jgi:hypothetical protein
MGSLVEYWVYLFGWVLGISLNTRKSDFVVRLVFIADDLQESGRQSDKQLVAAALATAAKLVAVYVTARSSDGNNKSDRSMHYNNYNYAHNCSKTTKTYIIEYSITVLHITYSITVLHITYSIYTTPYILMNGRLLVLRLYLTSHLGPERAN